MDVREDYFRCGSCRAFEVAFQDRMGRSMGQCDRKPRTGQVAAHDYACRDYRLERTRLIPGARVPDEATLATTPREQERRRALDGAATRLAALERQHSSRPTRRPDADDEPRPKLREIPLGTEGDEAMNRDELKGILAEVLDEALGLSDPPMQRRYRGGKVIIQPGDASLAPKEIEVEVLFRKVTSVRDRLRVLEQKLNATEALSDEDRAVLQGYISNCYGTMKSFNFLFAERDDWFAN